jgi:hypothetical protein
LTPPNRRARGLTSALAIASVAALTLVALELRPHDSPAAVSTEELVAPDTAVVPTVSQRFDTLRAGETLSGLLGRAGLSVRDAAGVLAAASTIDMRRLPVGMPVTYTAPAADSIPTEVVFQLAIDRMLHVRRDVDGWASEDVRIPVVPQGAARLPKADQDTQRTPSAQATESRIELRPRQRRITP